MNLRYALELMSFLLNLDADGNQLMAYADEDDIGGFHFDERLRKWETGSLWEVEGKFLYALVRAMRPLQVLEIGTWRGASATHILAALHKNDYGYLTSVDLLESGQLIPDELRYRWHFVQSDGAAYLRSSMSCDPDIIFEDGLHDPLGTTAMLQEIKAGYHPRLLLSHDAEHYIVGKDVRQAFIDVFGSVNTLLIDPSDCGFAYRIEERT